MASLCLTFDLSGLKGSGCSGFGGICSCLACITACCTSCSTSCCTASCTACWSASASWRWGGGWGWGGAWCGWRSLELCSLILDRSSISVDLFKLSSTGEVLATILRDLAGGCLDFTHSFLDSGGCALSFTGSSNSLILFLNWLDISLCLLDLLLSLFNLSFLSRCLLDVLVLLGDVRFFNPRLPFGIQVFLVLRSPLGLFLIMLSLGVDSWLIPFPYLLVVLVCLSCDCFTALSQLLFMLNSLLLFNLSLIIVLPYLLLLLKSLPFDRLFPLLLDLNSSLSLLFDPRLSVLFSLDACLFLWLSDSLWLDSSLFGLLLPLANLLIVSNLSLFLVLSLSLDISNSSLFLFNSALFDLLFPGFADLLVERSHFLFALHPQLILVLFSDPSVLLVDSLLSDSLLISLLRLICFPVFLGILLLVPFSDLLLLLFVVLALLEPPFPVSLLIRNPSFVRSVTSAFVSILPKFITVLIFIIRISLFSFFLFVVNWLYRILNIIFCWFWHDCRFGGLTFLSEAKVISIILLNG